VNIKVIDQLYTDFTISERSLSDLRKVFADSKLAVLVSADAPEAKPREGQLIFLDNAVDNTTGTISLRAIVPNSDHFFWPGQFVRVKLVLSTLKDAVLVPSAAIQVGQSGTYLFAVKDDGTADLRLVKAGPNDGNFTVVYDNVKPGEKIVTAGTLMLRPGTAVIDASTIQHAAQDKTAKKDNKSHTKK
jgi:multidrug efflux system membrane fusion protein